MLLLCLMLAGCYATKGGSAIETRIVDTGCNWAAPIYVSRDDVLTLGTAQQILAHNRAGAKICDWKPRQK